MDAPLYLQAFYEVCGASLLTDRNSQHSPFGTHAAVHAHPALKRSGILNCPSGTDAVPRRPLVLITRIQVAFGEDARATLLPARSVAPGTAVL